MGWPGSAGKYELVGCPESAGKYAPGGGALGGRCRELVGWPEAAGKYTPGCGLALI